MRKPEDIKILVGCEESQSVTIAFRERGFEAYSCDLQDCSGGHPEWHLKMDAVDAIDLISPDLGVFHPPCTFFSRAGIQFIHTQPDRLGKLKEAFEFVLKIHTSKIPKICIENPVGWLNTNWLTPDQIVHPYYFGDKEMKETCFWLKGLPKLKMETDILRNHSKYKPQPTKSRIGSDGKMKNAYFMTHSKNAKERSKTFRGIAKAMAEQWGDYLLLEG
jgi:hypothetical protein